jgi:hypothetical protein
VRLLPQTNPLGFDVQLQSLPTAHEQLEAALQLRDWLRKHEAPPEIEALLPL